jgi:putative transcriptional regulator
MISKIKELRNELGLSQEELANRVGVRRETMIFLEKGKYNPSLRLAYKTAKALNTTIDGLFSFDDEG